MRSMRLFWLAGPLVVRDLVAGSSAIIAALFAFIGGCALASSGTLVWFSYFGLLGAVSLATSLTQLRRVGGIWRAQVRDDDFIHALPLAA